MEVGLSGKRENGRVWRSRTKTDSNWQKWSEIDPYYAVLTVPKYRKPNLLQNRIEFFKTGDAYVKTVLTTISNHFGRISHKRALDFGCGVGRLVIPLAMQFDEVVGADIADEMLEEARANCIERNLRNVVFIKSDDKLSRIDRQFNFINSYLVMQHIPRKRGMRIIQSLLQAVEPNGVIALHISFLRKLPLLSEVGYIVSNFIPGGNFVVNLWSGGRLDEPSMRASQYDLLRILKMFSVSGFSNVLVSQQEYGSIVNMLLIAQRAS